GLLYVPGSALLILGLAYGKGLLVAHLRSPFLKQLGMASFCLYMMQAPILRSMKGIWMVRGWQVDSWTGALTVMAGMFVLVQAAAFLMHRNYELPIQTVLRTKMLRRIQVNPPSRSIAHGAVG